MRPSSKHFSESWGHAAQGHRVRVFPLIRPKDPKSGSAQPQCLPEHCIEHQRQITWRGIDDLQDFGGRGLLGQHLVALESALRELAPEVGDDKPGICWILADRAHPAASAVAMIACAIRGKRIVNSVNSPSRLSTAIVPPCCWVTMSQLIERPKPVPSPVGLVVKNGWKSLSRVSGGIPVPLSRTRTSTASPRSRVDNWRVGR